MSPRTAALLRYWVNFWIIAPLAITALLLLIIAVGGNLAGPNAQGMLARFSFAAGLFALLAPVVAAHIVTAAALVGVCGVLAGMRADWRLHTVIAVGLITGSAVLYRLYFVVAV